MDVVCFALRTAGVGFVVADGCAVNVSVRGPRPQLEHVAELHARLQLLGLSILRQFVQLLDRVLLTYQGLSQGCTA